MNLRLWWLEVKNSAEAIAWLLAISVIVSWVLFNGFSKWRFNADMSLLLPFITTHSFGGLMSGVICLPIVTIFRTSLQKHRSSREAFLMVLPMSRWKVALHRYLTVVGLQFALIAVIMLITKFAFLLSAVPGFAIWDRETRLEFATMILISTAFIAVFHIANYVFPKKSFVISWAFGSVLAFETFFLHRFRFIEPLMPKLLPWAASAALVLVALELSLYLKKSPKLQW